MVASPRSRWAVHSRSWVSRPKARQRRRLAELSGWWLYVPVSADPCSRERDDEHEKTTREMRVLTRSAIRPTPLALPNQWTCTFCGAFSFSRRVWYSKLFSRSFS